MAFLPLQCLSSKQLAQPQEVLCEYPSDLTSIIFSTLANYSMLYLRKMSIYYIQVPECSGTCDSNLHCGALF